MKMKTQIEDRKRNLEALSELSPEVESRQAAIARFFLANSGIIGISYEAAAILMKEKNIILQKKAIKLVANELVIRSDTTSKEYCVTRRNISENRVRKIISDLKNKNKPPQKNIKSKDTRSEIFSFRTTEAEDNCISFLSNGLCVSRSELIDVLIKAKNRFNIELNK